MGPLRWASVVVFVLGSWLLCRQAVAVSDGAVTEDNRTLTLALLVPFSQTWNLGTEVGSAIVPALQEVERLQLLPGYHVRWTLSNSACVANVGKWVEFTVWSAIVKMPNRSNLDKSTTFGTMVPVYMLIQLKARLVVDITYGTPKIAKLKMATIATHNI